MRGHLVAEINILQSIFGFGRIWLLPANPEKGRKIVAGNYEVNGTRLDQTVFATDPDFPMHSSSVDDILKTQSSNLFHCHIDTEGDVPLSGLVTADVSSKADFKKYMKNLQDNDLWCGAASCFEAFLESMGLSENKLAGSAPADKNLHRLIINGSTVKKASEALTFKGLNIPHLSLPGFWEGELFMLDRGTENKWMERVRRLLQSHEIVAVSIDHPVKPLKSISNIFSNHLIKLMHHIIRKFRNKTVHFGLTGGATAYDLISSTGIAKFQVLKEVSPGVVTLRGIGGPEVLFTVKPGSYAWPDDFLK